MGVVEYRYKLMWLRPTHVSITIPQPWVRALGLRQGEATWVKVIVRHDGSLVVVLDEKKKETKEPALVPAADDSSTPPEETEEVAKNE